MSGDTGDKKEIKCVVWDLDGTLWEGILLESNEVKLKPGIRQIIQTLDSRGILHSIASKSDYDDALAKIKEFKLEAFFLYPEISWNAKSTSIKRIQENLNIGLDTIMFIDDQPFERDEVQHEHPEVFCLDASQYRNLPDHPRLNPRFITEDSKKRRHLYLADMKRKKIEQEYEGPKQDFLMSLDMTLIISQAKEEDLKRAEELTVRTNQLNTTGVTYDFDELKRFLSSDDYRLFICELRDKYGSHGKIGLALVEITDKFWQLKLFLMSCRVLTYGVGTVFLSYILNEAKKAGMIVRSDFRDTGRNRMMYITFKFANFREIQSQTKGEILLENNLTKIQEFPPYIHVIIQ